MFCSLKLRRCAMDRIEYQTQPVYNAMKIITDVHGEAGIVACSFAVASLFALEAKKYIGGFPLLYIDGPAASGKTSIVRTLMRMMDSENGNIHLPNSLSIKKKVKKLKDKILATKTIISFDDLDLRENDNVEILKSLWDSFGYQRGEDSNQNSFPIFDGGFIVEGPYHLESEALFSRFISLQMNRENFLKPIQHKLYDELEHYDFESFRNELYKIKSDKSDVAPVFLPIDISEWKEEINKVANQLTERSKGNIAIICGIMSFLKPVLVLPFQIEKLFNILINNALEMESFFEKNGGKP
jgi:DNA primase